MQFDYHRVAATLYIILNSGFRFSLFTNRIFVVDSFYVKKKNKKTNNQLKQINHHRFENQTSFKKKSSAFFCINIIKRWIIMNYIAAAVVVVVDDGLSLLLPWFNYRYRIFFSIYFSIYSSPKSFHFFFLAMLFIDWKIDNWLLTLVF